MQVREFSDNELVDAEECAAQLMLAVQMATKSKTDAVKHSLAYHHADFGSGNMTVTLKSGANYETAGKKEVMSMFGIDWETAKEFKISLVSSKIVNRRPLRH
jgi:hypothetical protein